MSGGSVMKRVFGCGCLFLLLGALFLYLRFGSLIHLSRMEVDEDTQEFMSPDHSFVARTLYREALSMTYGYYIVQIRDCKDSGEFVDVVEFAAEGLESVGWRDSKTLEVRYDGTKHKDHLEDTLFVRQPTIWQGVTLVYVPILKHDTTAETTRTTT